MRTYARAQTRTQAYTCTYIHRIRFAKRRDKRESERALEQLELERREHATRARLDVLSQQKQVYLYIVYVHIHTCTCTSVFVPTYTRLEIRWRDRTHFHREMTNIFLCLFVCFRHYNVMYLYIYMSIHLHTFTYMHVFIYVCMHVCTHPTSILHACMHHAGVRRPTSELEPREAGGLQ